MEILTVSPHITLSVEQAACLEASDRMRGNLMPGNCDALNQWLSTEEQRQTEALNALNSATENATMATATLAAANMPAAPCNLLIANLAAYSDMRSPGSGGCCRCRCYAVNYYNDKAREAAQAYKDIGAAIDTLNKLIADCTVAEADQRDGDVTAAVNEGKTAFDSAEGVSIPDVSDEPLSDAQTKVAEAEDATKQAQDSTAVF